MTQAYEQQDSVKIGYLAEKLEVWSLSPAVLRLRGRSDCSYSPVTLCNILNWYAAYKNAENVHCIVL